MSRVKRAGRKAMILQTVSHCLQEALQRLTAAEVMAELSGVKDELEGNEPNEGRSEDDPGCMVIAIQALMMLHDRAEGMLELIVHRQHKADKSRFVPGPSPYSQFKDDIAHKGDKPA